MRAALGILTAAACLAAEAAAAEAPAGETKLRSAIPHEAIPARDHFTGDWGGWRARLNEGGLDISASYIGEVLANVEGGNGTGAIYSGLFQLGLDLDTAKAGWWENGAFRASSLYPHGNSLTDKYVGDLLRLSNIDAYDSLRLYEFWYEHRFFNDRFSLKLGQIAADQDFATLDNATVFLNSAHGWPAFVSANAVNGGPGYFVAATGARAALTITDNLSWQIGIFDGDTFDDSNGNPRVNRDGLRVDLSDAQGFIAMTEAAWRNYARSYPSALKLGAWLHTGETADLHDDATGSPAVVSGLAAREHDFAYGLYASAEQTIWLAASDQPEGRSAAVFLRAGIGPGDRNPLEFVMNGGVIATGLIPVRPLDRTGLGFIYAQVSRDARRAERADRDINGAPIRALSDYEAAIELTHEVRINSWWTFQPDVQFIIHPGGSRATDNAVIVGVRTSIAF